ncbi:peroxiredoxin, partial [Halarcobacter anaerophilus]
MACDTGAKAIEETKVSNEENKKNIEKKEEKMSSSLVLRKVPEFKMDAYDAKTGHYTEVSSEDYKGKWHVVCFYPADFTFVCPTEIAAMNAKYDEFQELGVEILAVSTDTKFSHKRFVETEPLLKDLKLTIGADGTGEVSRAFGVMIE